MSLAHRIRPALGASLKHLGLSIAVAAITASLVFGVWYPFPYREISGGRELFVLVMSVDVVAGPLLTLFVYSPRKPRAELWRDLGVIVALQLSALGYGLFTVYAARPVVIGFEGNRFRVASAAEIEPADLAEAPGDLGKLSLTGPRLIGVRLANSSDADFLASIKKSMEGLHPTLRPSRWVPFDSQRAEVVKEAKPLEGLRSRSPGSVGLIDEAVIRAGLPIDRLGYLPLLSRTHSDWIVIVDRESGWPKAFAHVDGW